MAIVMMEFCGELSQSPVSCLLGDILTETISTVSTIYTDKVGNLEYLYIFNAQKYVSSLNDELEFMRNGKIGHD